MNKEKFLELRLKVQQWAKDRGLLDNVTEDRAIAQSLKLLEEAGETAKAILKKDREGLIDGIGDIAVVCLILEAMITKVEMEEIDANNYDFTYDDHLRYDAEALFDLFNGRDIQWTRILTTISKRNGLELVDCLESAYNEIKDRKGKLVGDTFIKESELVSLTGNIEFNNQSTT